MHDLPSSPTWPYDCRAASGDLSQKASLRPHGCTVNPELSRQRGHADAVLAGCSHSVHFCVREACSKSSPWLCRRFNERVIRLAIRCSTHARTLIPRGDKALDLLSPVPAVLNQVHHLVEVRTLPG